MNRKQGRYLDKLLYGHYNFKKVLYGNPVKTVFHDHIPIFC